MEIEWAFGLAAFAGFIRYIQRFTAKKEERPPFEYGPAFVAVLTGGFVGILALWLVRKNVSEVGYVYTAVALAGYGGPLTLDFLWEAGKGFALQILQRAAQKPPDAGPKM